MHSFVKILFRYDLHAAMELLLTQPDLIDDDDDESHHEDESTDDNNKPVKHQLNSSTKTSCLLLVTCKNTIILP